MILARVGNALHCCAIVGVLMAAGAFYRYASEGVGYDAMPRPRAVAESVDAVASEAVGPVARVSTSAAPVGRVAERVEASDRGSLAYRPPASVSEFVPPKGRETEWDRSRPSRAGVARGKAAKPYGTDAFGSWFWGKKPLAQRPAKRKESTGKKNYTGNRGTRAENVCPTMEGDVYIDSIPMIDQGQKPWCAIASAARVLESYGIETTAEDFAAAVGASETQGAPTSRWFEELNRMLKPHGLDLVCATDLTIEAQPLCNTVIDYDHAAYRLERDDAVLEPFKYARVGLSDYAGAMGNMYYDVRREMMLSDLPKCNVFAQIVHNRIDSSDPIFWSVTYGYIKEATGEVINQQSNDHHMRLIIGYNDNRDEVLYSDSWGEGHELKRMDASDALSITDAIYYVK